MVRAFQPNASLKRTVIRFRIRIHFPGQLDMTDARGTDQRLTRGGFAIRSAVTFDS